MHREVEPYTVYGSILFCKRPILTSPIKNPLCEGFLLKFSKPDFIFKVCQY